MMKPVGLSEAMKFAPKVEVRNAYCQSNNRGSSLGSRGNMGSAPLVYSSLPARPIPFIPAIGSFHPI